MSQINSDLSNLKAPRPVLPKFTLQTDKRVYYILKELEKIRNSKKRKQLKKCEHLVYYITQTLRKAKEDHLLQTTAVWVLIVVFRLFPVEIKAVMLQSGIPGILHDILKLGLLSGSSRQYASELVFFLTTNHTYEANPGGGPMTKFPEIQAYNRYQPDLDDISILSDVSGSDNNDRPYRKAFIPYRIDAQNMIKMDSLFEKGYGAQLAASLPNVGMMSKFGFSHDQDEIDEDELQFQSKYQRLASTDERDEDDEDDDDDDNDNENGVSESSSEGEDERSRAGSNDDRSRNSGDVNSSNLSFNSFNLHPNKDVLMTKNRRQSSNLAIIGKKKKSEVYRRNSFLMHQYTDNNSLSSLPTQRKMTVNQLYKSDIDMMERPKTSSALPEPGLSAHQMDGKTKPMTATHSPFRLGKINENKRDQKLSHLMEDSDDLNSLGYSSQNGSSVMDSIASGSVVSKGGVFATQSLDRFPKVASAPHRMVQQLRSEYNQNENNNYGETSRGALASAPAGTIMNITQRPQTISTMRYGHRKRKDHTGDDESAHGFSGFFGPPARSTPQTPHEIYARKKFSASILSATQPLQAMSSTSVDQLMSELDPFAVPATMASSMMTDAPNKVHTMKKFSNRFRVNIGVPDYSKRDVDLTSDIDEDEMKNRKRKNGVSDEEGDKGGGRKKKVGEARFEDEDEAVDNLVDEYWDSSDEEMNDYYQKLVESEIEEETLNPFIKIKRLRIRAEKLIDHKFIHALFVKKMTVQDTQDLIRRMEDIIFLLDPEETGYISFEQFTKIICAVAPKHLLKKNIHQFFEFQTESMSNMIDYQEFLISGKVLILTRLQQQQYETFKKKGKSVTASTQERQMMQDTNEVFSYRNENSTYTKAWLSRQKLYVGEASTYTWKNHIKWYQKRKSQVLIWLIRRARRALEYEIQLIKSFDFLKKIRWKAFAQTDLMAIGRDALLAQQQREEAKKRLTRRVYHARTYMRKVKDAFEFLKFVGYGAIKDLDYYERHYGQAAMTSATNSAAAAEKNLTSAERVSLAQQRIMREALAKIQEQKMQVILQKKVNYSNLYKVHELQKLAVKALKIKSAKALKHCSKQDIANESLVKYAKKVLLQQFKKEKIRRELVMMAERALAFCLEKDQIQLALLRIGTKKREWLCNQIDSLEWLTKKGQHTKVFLEQKYAKGYGLISKARQILNFMNQREHAFAYLSQRCQKSKTFIARKQEAIEFLRKKPYKLWDVLDHQDEVQLTLAAIGRRAKQHMRNKKRSATFLQYIASKALSQHRRSQVTFQELCQIGMQARYEVFKQSLLKKENQRLYSIFLQEKALIIKNDSKIMQNYQIYYENRLRKKGLPVSPTRSNILTLPFSSSSNTSNLSPTARRRQAAMAAAMVSDHMSSSNPTPNNRGLTTTIRSNNQLEELAEEDEEEGHDYSAKVMTITNLSAKLNGIQVTSRPGTSPSRRLESNSSSRRSPEKQFILPTDTEGDKSPQILSLTAGLSSNQLLPIDEISEAPTTAASNNLEEENATPSRTFELTALSQAERSKTSRPPSPEEVIREDNPIIPRGDNSHANFLSNPSSPPIRPFSAASSRPASSQSPSRLRTPLLNTPSAMGATLDRTLSRPGTALAADEEPHPLSVMVENIVKLEIIECFQLISSIYTPHFVLAKNKLQKLQLILPSIGPNNNKGSKTNSRAPSANKNKSPLKRGMSSLNRPNTAPSSSNLLSQPSILNQTTQKKETNDEEDELQSSTNNNAQYDIIGRLGFIKLLNSGKYLTLNEIAVKETFRNLDTNTSCYVTITNVYYYLWKELKKKHKLVKYLMNNPTIPRPITASSGGDLSRPGTAPTNILLLTNGTNDRTAVSRRGLTQTAGSTPTTSTVVKKSIPPHRIIMNDILTADERAVMILYKRMMRDDAFYHSLLETEKSGKKLSAFEEYKLKMQKLAEERALAENEDDGDDEYNYGDEEDDEDLLFSDLERLKKMDVGRLMKYLTKKRESKKDEEGLANNPNEAKEGSDNLTTQLQVTVNQPSMKVENRPSSAKKEVFSEKAKGGVDDTLKQA